MIGRLGRWLERHGMRRINRFERFQALTPEQRRIVQEILVEKALAVWTAYAREQGRIEYVETVVGTRQTVDLGLPADALAAVRSGERVAEVKRRYGEPLAAMRDNDLTFPEHVTFAYCAIYNFFCRYARHEDVEDWVIANQAGSAERDESKWSPTLVAAIEDARRRSP